MLMTFFFLPKNNWMVPVLIIEEINFQNAVLLYVPCLSSVRVQNVYLIKQTKSPKLLEEITYLALMLLKALK